VVILSMEPMVVDKIVLVHLPTPAIVDVFLLLMAIAVVVEELVP